jgi:transcriptional regulator with XRE-family HTH domain
MYHQAEKVTQSRLAKLTGNKQQVISRIENKENMPTLRTFCNLLSAIGYELQIVKKRN